MKRRLALPARLLAIHALVLAASYAVDAGSGTVHDPYGFCHGGIEFRNRIVYGALALLGVLGGLGTLANHRRGPLLLVAALIAHGVVDVPNRLLWVSTSPYRDTMAAFPWMSATHVVFYRGLFIAVAVSYLRSTRVRQATEHEAAVGAEDSARRPGKQSLPWAGRLAGIFAIGCGAHGIAWSMTETAGLALPGPGGLSDWFGWLARWTFWSLSRRVSWGLVALVGLGAGLGLLFRREWGRRLLIVFALLQAVRFAGDWCLACAMDLTLGLPPSREYWDVTVGVVTIALHAAFLASYLRSKDVQQATKRAD